MQPRPPADQKHLTEAGANLERTFVRTSDQFTGSIGELVDRTPVEILRQWSHATTVALFATDRIVLSPVLTHHAGIRFESTTGRADGGANGVAWPTLATPGGHQVAIGNKALIAGYRRSANRLNLDLLAFGDPNAQTADRHALSSSAVGGGRHHRPCRPRHRRDPFIQQPEFESQRALHGRIRDQHPARGRWAGCDFGLTGIARREANHDRLSKMSAYRLPTYHHHWHPRSRPRLRERRRRS